jgi:hypothetical protein
MKRLGRRSTGSRSYANVAATMALVFALSGGAYAAATLPPNSVGSAQIRSDAVGSSELRNGGVRSRDVRDGALQAKDLSSAARTSLRGQTGPAGPGGPAGVARRASIAAGGDPVAGNATRIVHSPGSHEYRVSFADDIRSCVPTATLTTPATSADTEAAGRIAAVISGSDVLVRTYDAGGTRAPEGFNLLVAC